MLRLLIDENFNADVIHAVRRAEPGIDILTAAETELRHAPDEMILERAAAFDRVVVTSDVQTMVGFAHRRIAAGERMPGLIVGPMYVRVRVLVEDLLLLAVCLTPAEIAQQVRWLPLRY
jgi:hypothetical protein